jgi:hypothetical protein
VAYGTWVGIGMLNVEEIELRTFPGRQCQRAYTRLHKWHVMLRLFVQDAFHSHRAPVVWTVELSGTSVLMRIDEIEHNLFCWSVEIYSEFVNQLRTELTNKSNRRRDIGGWPFMWGEIDDSTEAKLWVKFQRNKVVLSTSQAANSGTSWTLVDVEAKRVFELINQWLAVAKNEIDESK